MEKIEKFYKEAGGIEYDKFDKKVAKFTYYDMIGFANAYHSKQLSLNAVSYRRELLLAYTTALRENFIGCDVSQINHRDVDWFLEANNCG